MSKNTEWGIGNDWAVEIGDGACNWRSRKSSMRMSSLITGRMRWPLMRQSRCMCIPNPGWGTEGVEQKRKAVTGSVHGARTRTSTLEARVNLHWVHCQSQQRAASVSQATPRSQQGKPAKHRYTGSPARSALLSTAVTTVREKVNVRGCHPICDRRARDTTEQTATSTLPLPGI